LAFTVNFAVWTMFSVIGIRIKQQLGLNETEFGLLVATPILTGSLVRLPLGILTDRYGGRVDKILGDGILALFGAPVAHEDDPDRAIRAALQMHRSLAEFVEDNAGLGRPLELRIGVNTGEVLVGSLAGTVEYTAMGDVVNVASRLEALTKELDAQLVVSAALAERAGIDLAGFELRQIEIRGRRRPLRVRLVGDARSLPVPEPPPQVVAWTHWTDLIRRGRAPRPAS